MKGISSTLMKLNLDELKWTAVTTTLQDSG